MAEAVHQSVPDPAAWAQVELPGFVTQLGAIYRSTSPERPGSFLFPVETRHLNLNGVMHGGVFMAVADTVMGLSGALPGAHVPKATIQFDAHFLAPVAAGAMLALDCLVIRRTGSMLFLDCVASVDGQSVASARGVWRIIRPKT